MATLTRRSVLTAISALTLSKAAPKNIRLGGPIFLNSDDPRELAREHRRLGYSAALCPRAKAIDSARRNHRRSRTTNRLEPDSEKRRANMHVIERLALAEAVGERCCVNTAS